MDGGDYGETLLACFRRPEHAGTLDRDDPGVVTARLGEAGDERVVDLTLCIDDDVITSARFLAYGCPATIACMEWLCRRVEGHGLREAGELHNAVIAEALALPPLKIECAVLAEGVLRRVLKERSGLGS